MLKCFYFKLKFVGNLQFNWVFFPPLSPLPYGGEDAFLPPWGRIEVGEGINTA